MLKNKDILEIQNPIIYMGEELNQITKKVTSEMIRFAFCFPEVYEVGMSYLGMKILYNILNMRNDTYCERVFAPSCEMEELMKKNNIELYGLESKESIRHFDFIGFTLQYELTYTNILNMLSLANVPIFSKDRIDSDPYVIAGGPCACNPEPLADFVDIFFMGEGEDGMSEIMDVYAEAKRKKLSREDFLKQVDMIEGVYVPSLYEVKYNEEGIIKEFVRKDGKIPYVKKRIIANLDDAVYPTKPVVPYSKVVHDRVALEVFRGCIRGCRFCQAGYLYRPVREKSVDKCFELAKEAINNTGYEELSLTSLSTSDYTRFNELTEKLMSEFNSKKVNISLPSLRIDSIKPELLDKLKEIRKSGLTYAPEAGTQRLRNVINKNVTEENIFDACKLTFEKGWNTVKLYFMLGLPTETYEDLDGIADIANRVVGMYHKLSKNKKNKLRLSVSVSTFVPKPFTPFEWVGQDSNEEIHKKIEYLKKKLSNREISFTWTDVNTSFLEAIIARGDRRLGQCIYDAWQMGCKFDGWNEHFDFSKWQKSFENNNIQPEFYAKRLRQIDEILPWDFIDICVTKEFLKKEYTNALEAKTTPNCRQQCNGCGASGWKAGVCFEN